MVAERTTAAIQIIDFDGFAQPVSFPICKGERPVCWSYGPDIIPAADSLNLLMSEDAMIKSGLLAGSFVLFLTSFLQAGDAENRQLYALIKANGPAIAQAEAIRKHFSAKQLADGSAVAAYGGDFVWAIQTEQKPSIIIDDGQPSEMRLLPNGLWVHTARLTTGRSHAHQYRIAGRILGDRRFDTAAYTTTPRPRAPGTLTEQLVCLSQVYRGWKISY
jgi:hypothetical protein